MIPATLSYPNLSLNKATSPPNTSNTEVEYFLDTIAFFRNFSTISYKESIQLHVLKKSKKVNSWIDNIVSHQRRVIKFKLINKLAIFLKGVK